MRLPDRRPLSTATAVFAAFGLLLGVTGCSLDEDQSPRSVAGWTHLHPGKSGIESVVTAPGNPNVVYVTILSDGTDSIFESSDGGTSWSRIPREDGAGFVLLAVDATRQGTLYARRSGAGLAKSMDGGASWIPANRGLPRASEGVPSVSVVTVDPTSSLLLYAGGESGIFKSANGGASWVRVWRAPKGTAVSALAIDPRRPAILYAGTTPTDDWQHGTVVKSGDHGRSWRKTGLRLRSGPVPGIDGIAIAARKPQTLYVTASYGFYKSEDGGESWTRLGPRAQDAETSVLFPSPTGCGSSCPLLAIDPSRPDSVYVSAYDVGTDESFVLKTTTGGRTWVSVARIKGQYGESFPLSSLAIDASGHRVYGGMEFGDLFVCEACWQKTSPPARRR